MLKQRQQAQQPAGEVDKRKNEDDITEQFFSQCAELAPGELAKLHSFTLGDAMNAIEIMDPKMDNGTVCADEGLGLNNALKNGTLKPETMTASQLIATMDGTYSMLAAWLAQGQLLDQTLLTNICLHEPKALRVSNNVLYVFSLAFLHLLHAIRGYIQLASVINEEDFYCNSTLDTSLIVKEEGQVNVCELLEEAMEKESKERTLYATSTPALAEAVRARLELLHSLFQLFGQLLPPLNSQGQLIENGTKFVPNFKRARHLVAKCLSLMKKVTATTQLGLDPPSPPSDQSDGCHGDGDFSWLACFQPGVNQQRAPAGFQREAKFLPRQEALSYLHNVLEKVAVMVIEVPEKAKELDDLLNLCKDFGSEDSCPLTRSILQLMLMPNDTDICGILPLQDIVRDAIDHSDIVPFVELLLPKAAPTHGALASRQKGGCGATCKQDCKHSQSDVPSIGELLGDYLGYLTKAFGALIQCHGHNVARQRSEMLKLSIEDFGILFSEGEKLEAEIESRVRSEESGDSHQRQPLTRPVLTNFVIYHLLQLVYNHFELGFRLELFVPYEFAYTYWCFADTTRTLTNILDRRCNALILNYSKLASANHHNGGDKNKKKSETKRQQQKLRAEAEFRRNIALLQQRSLVHNVEIAISVAMFKFMVALELSGRLTIPPGEAMRYDRRTEPFAPLSRLIYTSYEDYLTQSKMGSYRVNAASPLNRDSCKAECFTEAAYHFEQAANLLKNLESQIEDRVLPPRVATMLKVARQNAVVSRLLLVSSKLIERQVHFEFIPEERLMFPLIKLT